MPKEACHVISAHGDRLLQCSISSVFAIDAYLGRKYLLTKLLPGRHCGFLVLKPRLSRFLQTEIYVVQISLFIPAVEVGDTLELYQPALHIMKGFGERRLLDDLLEYR